MFRTTGRQLMVPLRTCCKPSSATTAPALALARRPLSTLELSSLSTSHPKIIAAAPVIRLVPAGFAQGRFFLSSSGAARPPAPGTSLKANLKPNIAELSVADKVVIISGGARGLGLTQAEALLEGGAKVYALDLLPDATPEFHELKARAPAGSLHFRAVDVRDEAKLHATVASIADDNGRLDGLIAAAGINEEYTALEYTAADFKKMMDINVCGAFLTAQATARQMVRLGKGGSIVMIGSMSARISNRGLICPAYNASKAAVVQLVKNMASEWGKHDIRVNAISPGYIVTKMVENLFEKFPERRETWPTENMLGRLSAPEDYRGLAVYLISDASSFMTGSDVLIDGGHSSW